MPVNSPDCESNLLAYIWTRPKATLGYILKNCPNKYLYILLTLAGIGYSILQVTLSLPPEEASVLTVVSALFFGGICGWISFYIYAAMLSWTGNWLNGQTTTNHFLSILAWAMIPTICSLLLIIPQAIFLRDNIFNRVIGYTNPVYWAILSFVEVTLIVWSFVIFITGVALAQNFSTTKAILNALLPFMVLAIPIGLLILVFVR